MREKVANFHAKCLLVQMLMENNDKRTIMVTLFAFCLVNNFKLWEMHSSPFFFNELLML